MYIYGKFSEAKRERKICIPRVTTQMPVTAGAQAMPKSGGRSSICVLHVCSRNHSPWPITCSFPRLMNKPLDQGSEGRGDWKQVLVYGTWTAPNHSLTCSHPFKGSFLSSSRYVSKMTDSIHVCPFSPLPLLFLAYRAPSNQALVPSLYSSSSLIYYPQRPHSFLQHESDYMVSWLRSL